MPRFQSDLAQISSLQSTTLAPLFLTAKFQPEQS